MARLPRIAPLRPPLLLGRPALVACLAVVVGLAASGVLAQGFPNVTQTPGTLLSDLEAPQQGRTAIIAYHNGLLYTVPELPSSQPNSDFQVRSWDLSNPASPVELEQFGISPMPVNAHGYLQSGDYLVIGPNWPPEAPWSFEAQSFGVNQRTEWPDLMFIGTRGTLTQPWVVSPTYWSYGEVEGMASIQRQWDVLAEWDHLGLTGVVGHPILLGDLLIFASDQSRTGVATYDVSDPTNPVLLDVLTTGGPGGYWPEVWGGDGKLYVVFPYRVGGNGIRVVDATDPTDLRFLADTPLPGDASMYVQFQDEFAFTGSHKVDMRTFQSVLDLDGANVQRPDGEIGVDTSQFLLPLGNLLVTGGIGPNQGMAIWAHQAAPDTRGPSVGYHVPQAGRTNYPLDLPISLLIHETLDTTSIVNGTTFLVRPLGGQPITGRLVFSFNDILTFTPDAPLAPDTTYEVVLPAGGIRDAAGNGMVGYTFTFSTGGAVGGNGVPEIASLDASLYPAAPGQSVTLQASASDPDQEALEYRFDFGDGSPRTAWSSSDSTQHAYAAAGHYRASVQARDPSGALATRSTTVTVLVPPAGPRPTHGATIACDDGARRIFKVNPDNDTVAALDADTSTLLWEQPACDDPRSLAVVADELWIACRGDDRVVVLGAAVGDARASVPFGWGAAPAGLAATPDGSTVFVALEGAGELQRLDVATRSATGSLALGPRPRAVAVSGDGSDVYVTRLLSPRDWGEVWHINAGAMTLERTLRIPKFGGDEHRDGTAEGRGVANYLVDLAITPDGSSLWVASNKPNAERGTFFHDDLDQDNTVRNIVSRLDLASGALGGVVDLDNSDSASALGFSPLGDYLMVALQGNDELLVLDALRLEEASGLGALVTRLGTGAAPRGVCVDPTTRRTLVENFVGRSVSVLDTDALLREGAITASRVDRSTVGAESLPAQILHGKRLFHHASDPRMSGEGYMSCASCHLDGGHDGRTWDFHGRGEGFRNTTDLRGRGGMAQGNVHWTANFDEIQDFENDIRNAFGGLGFLTDQDFAITEPPLGPIKAGLSTDLDALAAYVASLDTMPRSPHRASNGALTPAGVAGRGHFATLGCASCHAGAAFTDSSVGAGDLRDVGTLRTTSGQRLGGPLSGIDTPTLLGVWDSAPYFHDGSAPTLGDVFRIAGGTTIQGETGTVQGGGGIADQYIDLNHDDTVHGRAFAYLQNGSSTLTLAGVDGGSGGLGAVELRYSLSYPRTVTVTVGGTTVSTPAEPTGNDPLWRHTNWGRLRLEGVPLAAGAGNVVTIGMQNDYGDLSIDDVTISTADDLAQAAAHRTALSLSASERDELIAFLRQLEGAADEFLVTEPPLFADGFESGNLDAWD